MHVRVRLDGRRPLRWHAALLRRIADTAGVRAVSLDDAPGPDAGPDARPDPWPDSAELLFRLEALIHGLRRAGSEPVPPAALDPWRRSDAAPDLVIDLCGDAAADVPVWRAAFDGQAGAGALLASLLAGAVPRFTLAEDGHVLAAGRLGSDQPGIVLASLDDAVARAATLILAALGDRVAGRPGRVPHGQFPTAAATVPAPAAGAIRARAAKTLARGIVQRLYRLCYHAPHWRTGWRRLDGPDLIDLGRHPDGGWTVLPDDGRRFYADPFPLAFGGATHVFVEDFPHATGKGLISAVRFGPDGPEGAPVPVLEEAHHLSYPFVFAREGAAWMVPESCAAGTVDLYRAARFPGGWVKEATLLSGVVASDATLVEHAGRWWLFATVRDADPGAPPGAGCFHDALHLWSAPDFRGPFVPHPANPVLVDPATARPAGRVVARGGRLIRPVQDCAQGYGRSLILARIDRLDADGYAQSVVGRIGPGAAWPGSRLHTLNAGGGIECIDGSGRAPRLRAMIGR